jgi:nucleoside-diphosphate-sugar epimerase
MQKILIIGGAGYIGSILTKYLLEKNYSVSVFDNFYYKQNSLMDCLSYKKFKLYLGDVRDLKTINTIISKYDIIIPLAALVGAPICSKLPKISKEINFDSCLNIIKNKSSSQRLIMPTTNSAYGSGNKNNFCDENSKLKPLSNYAKQKVKLEQILMEKKNVTSLRLATVFGAAPRMRMDLLVNDFVYKAYNDNVLVLFEGHFKRNYIHVKDVARCFHFCIENSKTKNEIFNVGLSTANLSKKELAEKIKKQVKSLNIIEKAFTKDPDQRNYIVSNEKIEKLGFIPKQNIDDGIKELLILYSFLHLNNYKNI